MIDNFQQISELLKFDNNKEFYFIQILQRNKENPQLGSNNRLIKAYYCFSKEYLSLRKIEMIKLAEIFNARIYIHLNRRDIDRIGFEMMEDLAKRLKDGTTENLYRFVESTCGKHNSEKDKSWIVDIDNYSNEDLNRLECTLSGISPLGVDKIITKIQTKNGVHLITKPFNTNEFSQCGYSEVEIHKNNPTLLYCT